MKCQRSIAATTLFLLFFSLLKTAATQAQTLPPGAGSPAEYPGGAERTIPWYIAHASFPMPSVKAPRFPDRTFTIRDYGALGDGQALNTAAFGKAIQACSASGGGHVIVPPGLWLTGPILLQDNVDLHLERGALVLFTPDHSQYPLIAVSNGNNKIITSPIYGHDLRNIAITGEGILDGGGDSWRPVKKNKTTAAQWKALLDSGGSLSADGSIWWPGKTATDNGGRDLRPYMVYLVNCREILLENVTIRNSPKFVFYPNKCRDLTMNHVNIFNEWWAQNGDGIDISACSNVVIYRCTVSAGDDGICMKSSGNRPAGGANLENVLIAGCTVYHGHGGFVIGSNTDGGMRNIEVADCNFIGTDIGLRFKSNMGRGGLVQNIFIHDIFLQDITGEAILFDTYYEDLPAGAVKDSSGPKAVDKIPEFRDFQISRVYCKGAKTAIAITGLPQMPVNRISFDNVVISSEKGLVATQAKGIKLDKVKLITRHQPAIEADRTAEIVEK